MTFQRFKDQIDDVMRDSLRNMGYKDQQYELLEPAKKEFGDITCNVAFLLGKKLNKSPHEIASTIVTNYLKDSIQKQQPKFITSVEAHAVGYINFTVDCIKLGGITLKTVTAGQKLRLCRFRKREEGNCGTHKCKSKQDAARRPHAECYTWGYHCSTS